MPIETKVESVDVGTAFVGGPLIPWGIVVSVVRTLVSRLDRFFSLRHLYKNTREARVRDRPLMW